MSIFLLLIAFRLTVLQQDELESKEVDTELESKEDNDREGLINYLVRPRDSFLDALLLKLQKETRRRACTARCRQVPGTGHRASRNSMSR